MCEHEEEEVMRWEGDGLYRLETPVVLSHNWLQVVRNSQMESDQSYHQGQDLGERAHHEVEEEEAEVEVEALQRPDLEHESNQKT